MIIGLIGIFRGMITTSFSSRIAWVITDPAEFQRFRIILIVNKIGIIGDQDFKPSRLIRIPIPIKFIMPLVEAGPVKLYAAGGRGSVI